MTARVPPTQLLTQDPWRGLIFEFVRRVSGTLFQGQTLTSWYRTPDENAAVGGSGESQHLFGIGLDVSGPHLETTKQLARRNGLIAVSEPSHLHLQLFPAGVLGRAGVDFPGAGSVRVAGVAGSTGE